MLNTIKGVYDHGKITLTEEPPVKTKADVIVTFLTPEKWETPESKRKLGGLEGKVDTPDDFNEPLDDLKDYM
jgi:hypothetical protein